MLQAQIQQLKNEERYYDNLRETLEPIVPLIDQYVISLSSALQNVSRGHGKGERREGSGKEKHGTGRL